MNWKIGLLIGCLLIGAPLMAETPEEKGLKIAQKADAVDAGFDDQTQETLMILKNQHGQKAERLLSMRILEVKGDGDKSLVIFHNPRDVKGTAFLSFTHKSGPDDQWLYLPALRRVKRIASTNKSGPFMGSEFAFEDIASQEVEKYTYKFIREDKLGDIDVFVVERYPVDPNSGYTRQIVQFDKDRYIPLQIDFYDRKSAHLKTLTFSGYQQYADKYWRADELLMVNHQSGKSTVLKQKNIKLKVGLNDKDFNKNALKRL